MFLYLYKAYILNRQIYQYYIYRISSYQAVNTFHLGYKTSQWVLYGETAWHGKKKVPPMKVQGDSWRFDIAEFKYDNHITYQCQRGGIKLKNYVCNNH